MIFECVPTILAKTSLEWRSNERYRSPGTTNYLPDLHSINFTSIYSSCLWWSGPVGSFRPDMIHAHLHEGMMIGKVVSVLFGVPLVADLQGSLTEEILDHQFIPRWPWFNLYGSMD